MYETWPKIRSELLCEKTHIDTSHLKIKKNNDKKTWRRRGRASTWNICHKTAWRSLQVKFRQAEWLHLSYLEEFPFWTIDLLVADAHGSQNRQQRAVRCYQLAYTHVDRGTSPDILSDQWLKSRGAAGLFPLSFLPGIITDSELLVHDVVFPSHEARNIIVLSSPFAYLTLESPVQSRTRELSC